MVGKKLVDESQGERRAVRVRYDGIPCPIPVLLKNVLDVGEDPLERVKGVLVFELGSVLLLWRLECRALAVARQIEKYRVIDHRPSVLATIIEILDDGSPLHRSSACSVEKEDDLFFLSVIAVVVILVVVVVVAAAVCEIDFDEAQFSRGRDLKKFPVGFDQRASFSSQVFWILIGAHN